HHEVRVVAEDHLAHEVVAAAERDRALVARGQGPGFRVPRRFFGPTTRVGVFLAAGGNFRRRAGDKSVIAVHRRDVGRDEGADRGKGDVSFSHSVPLTMDRVVGPVWFFPDPVAGVPTQGGVIHDVDVAV